MGEHLFKNWPVYILLAGFIWFVAKVYIFSQKEKKKQEQEKLQEGKSQAGKK